MSITNDDAVGSSLSLKSAQLNAIYRMLDFNGDESFLMGGGGSGSGSGSSSSSSTNGGSNSTYYNGHNSNSYNTNQQRHHHHHQWKILIYDTTCRSIISPILSVQQLRRKCNVTLHLLLHSDRETIPDVPAIYFVSPTRENLLRIVQDCTKQLYANIHINFVTKLERTLMEEFVQLLIQSSTSSSSSSNLQQIASIHDQYLNYICYENYLFTLQIPQSYITYNQSSTSEQVIDTYMTQIAYGLFSVIASYGQIPIIRCPKGGAPEMVARKLNRMIVEHPTLLQSSSSSQHHGGRPLLVILDRNSDLITPIQHCSTYQALIDDLLVHKANRVEFEVSNDSSNSTTNEKRNVNNKKPITKKYDLDPDIDPFYSVHKFVPFPEAIEQNDSELKDVTQREQLIRSKTTTTTSSSTTSNSNNVPDPFATAGATDLATAVDSLPMLIERKKQLEVHTSILQGVMNEVAARDVPQFYDIESSLATGTYKNDLPKAKKDVLGLISDPSKGNVYDKLRLVLVFALATNAKSTDLDEVTTAFQQVMELKSVDDKSIGPVVTAGMKAIAYIKQLRLMHMIPSANDSMMQELQSNKSKKTNEQQSVLSSFMAKATTQATGFLAKATDRVSSMLGKIHKHHVTVVTENLCDHMNRPNNVEDETYLYLDPKVKGDVTIQQLQSISLHRPPIHNAIVFMIGGGCYNEYQNIQSLLRTEKRTICYGSTELLDPNSFVQQLGQLG